MSGEKPWMKFYPSDWRADPALRMCGLAARGLWMEMLAIMHESTPRGMLLINSRPVANNQLAALVGVDMATLECLVSELELAGVFSRKKNGVIFSRRMERDENRARKNRENGKKGGNPSLSKQTINKESDNPRDKAQKPEARGQIPEDRTESPEKNRNSEDASAVAVASSKYAFEAETIKLIPRHFEGWKRANPHIQVESALWALDSWAGEVAKDGGNWFRAVANKLEKKEQEAMNRINAARLAQGADNRSSRLRPDPRI